MHELSTLQVSVYTRPLFGTLEFSWNDPSSLIHIRPLFGLSVYVRPFFGLIFILLGMIRPVYGLYVRPLVGLRIFIPLGMIRPVYGLYIRPLFGFLVYVHPFFGL